MKWCCSPYTTGITLGSFYIAGSVIAFIFELILFLGYDSKFEAYPEHRDRLKSDGIATMIKCGITVLISSLFILAIVKRKHFLIVPWLLFGIYVFYAIFILMYMWFIGAAMGGASGLTFIVLLLIVMAAIALEIAIFAFSCKLFMKIRNENLEKAERVQQQMYAKNLI